MKFAILIGHGESEGGSYDPGAVNGAYHEFRIFCWKSGRWSTAPV